MNNKIVTSKGPAQEITIINHINLENSFIKSIKNDYLEEIKNFLLTPKKFACVPITEDKLPISSISLDEDDVPNKIINEEKISNKNIKEIICKNHIKILSKEKYLNNHYALYMNKINDYLNTYNNEELDNLTESLEEIPKESAQNIGPNKNNNTSNAGYVNFTLLFVSVCFLSFLSISLGLLILGK